MPKQETKRVEKLYYGLDLRFLALDFPFELWTLFNRKKT